VKADKERRVRRERRVNKAQRDLPDRRGQKAIWVRPGRQVTPDLKVKLDHPAPPGQLGRKVTPDLKVKLDHPAPQGRPGRKVTPDLKVKLDHPAPQGSQYCAS